MRDFPYTRLARTMDQPIQAILQQDFNGAAVPAAALEDMIFDLPDGDDRAIFSVISTLGTENLARLSPDIRYHVLEKLGPRPSNASEVVRNRRNLTAALMLITQPYCENYEVLENTWVTALHKTREAKKLRAYYHRERPLLPDEIIDVASGLIKQQIAIFQELTGQSWPQLPTSITTFTLSRDDYQQRYGHEEASVYPAAVFLNAYPNRKTRARYPGLQFMTSRMVAFNVHRNAGPLTGGDVAYLGPHEALHALTYQMLALLESGTITSAQNPFAPMAVALGHEKSMYAFVLRNFSAAVYRCLISERMAYSLCQKFTALQEGRTPDSERILISSDITRANPDWKETIFGRAEDLERLSMRRMLSRLFKRDITELPQPPSVRLT